MGKTPRSISIIDPELRRFGRYYLLVITISVPFLVLGSVTGMSLLPGLPVSALMAVCPGLASLFLVWRDEGRLRARAFLARIFDAQRVRGAVWYIPILFLAPVQYVLAFFLLRAFGSPLPAPRVGALSILALCVMFIGGALAEELGWSGYATEPLVRRSGLLKAGLILGAAWAAFHYVALMEAHRSSDWVVWWTLWTIATRVTMVCLFSASGRSVFGISLFHAANNVGWQLFPVRGSYFDPRFSGLISVVTAILALAVWARTNPTCAIEQEEKT